MYSPLIFVCKIKPDSLLEALFGVLYKEEKLGDFSLPQNGRTKPWCIRTGNHIA